MGVLVAKHYASDNMRIEDPDVTYCSLKEQILINMTMRATLCAVLKLITAAVSTKLVLTGTHERWNTNHRE